MFDFKEISPPRRIPAPEDSIYDYLYETGEAFAKLGIEGESTLRIVLVATPEQVEKQDLDSP